MSKYRKKPVVIDAVQFLEGQPLPEGVNYGYPKERGDPVSHRLDGKYWIATLEGEHITTFGDWIINRVKGERYPCKAEIFNMTDAEVERLLDEYTQAIARSTNRRLLHLDDVANPR